MQTFIIHRIRRILRGILTDLADKRPSANPVAITDSAAATLALPALKVFMKATIISGLLLFLLLAAALTPAADMRGGELLHSLRAWAQPLRDADDLGPLLAAAGEARLVLLGEASHGTREFYVWRDRLSRRLIREGGFSFIAIEGDWAALLPLDRYVRHHQLAPVSAAHALLQVRRWPRWVWANAELAALGEWLRTFNRGRPADRRVGIHGMDLYAVWESLDAIRAFYRRRAPDVATSVDSVLGFLRSFDGDARGYADYVRRTGRSAQREVAWVARDLARRQRDAAPADRDALFEVLQHAKVLESGERYLRWLHLRGPWSWNVRADHFERTVARLLDHYGAGSRAIVWAHNTHIGDARATNRVDAGEVNIGQLARERFGRDAVFAVGFGTATGSVLAARRWEGVRRTMWTPLPRRDSLEAALLAAGGGDRVLILAPGSPATHALSRTLPHRAIGVVFDPRRERALNYVPSRLPERYDAFVFLPQTRALAPLHAE
jgi:erythromycin esterase-like protein